MPRGKYLLEAGSSKKLKVSWKFGWKDVRIRLDGQEVGQVGSKADLKQGRQFALPDGSMIEVRLAHRGLEVLRDGKPLPGAAWGDPIRAATIAVFWIATASVLLGVFENIGFFQAMGADVVGIPWWGNVAVGVVFGVLGFLVNRGQVTALVIAIVLTIGMLLSQVAATIYILSQGGVPLGVGAIAITAGLLIWMVKGLRAMRGLSPATPTSVQEQGELLSCPQCGAQYRPSDYREDVETWQCSSCKNPLPRKELEPVINLG